MRRLRRLFVHAAPAFVLSFLLLGCRAAPAVSAPSTTSASEGASASATAALADLERSSAGVLGLSAVALPSGRRLSFRGDAGFPMMSTVKLTVALALVRRVERGDVRLDDVVHVAKEDLSPGPKGDLASRSPDGFDLRVEALAEAMVEESDNTACDVLLPLVGGPAAVTTMLRGLGVDGVRVDRSERELGRDIEAEGPGFSSDPRDQTTPEAMTSLLTRIFEGRAAGPDGTSRLLGWLRATKTGARRLRAGFPAGTELLHKTGTNDDPVTNATNDVGIALLPDGSRLVIAVYLRDARAPIEERERLIARAASVAYAALVGR